MKTPTAAAQRSSTETDTQVDVTSVRGKHSTGSVRIQNWDKAYRTKRALKFLGVCWALALVSIVVPLAHFVLVPAFFIAGPVGASILHGQTSVVLGGKTKCPDCGADVEIVRSSDKWPLNELCSNCQSSLTITKISS